MTTSAGTRPRATTSPSQTLQSPIALLRFALGIVVVLAYPLVDRALGWGTLGAMLPILIYVMLALGLNIVVGYAGLLDLGYAAFFAIGAYTTAFLTSPQSVLPFRTDYWVALVASFFVASIFGVILGTPTLRLRGDYLAIVTLAFGEIVPRVFLNLESLTGGTKGINPIGRPSLLGFEWGFDQLPWYYLIVAICVVSIGAILRLYDSRLGRAWIAIREDELAAASLGVNTVTTKLLAFALGASFAGLAGSIFASVFQFIDPFQFDFAISILVLSMVILGGLGNIWGVIAGGVLMASFDRIFAERLTGWIQSAGAGLGAPILQSVNLGSSRMMIFGLALVLLMLLRPEGLFPSARRRRELREGDATETLEGVRAAP
ncbi:MAG TPA: branched-chain amino acid ABC transporter permease [Chloroflexota bacterium]|jgi:branched-chain amino acid transport system permease protein|nr:branched-chain amino acid ABC transporter permease [Chloroflexota bacterium]